MVERIILAGKYELHQKLGEGACSVVYLAWDRHTERFVAVKAEKNPTEGKDSDILKNEMEMLKMLRHPMLPAVYDFFLEDRCYLVMEYIEGESLHNFIEREGRLSEKQACEWALQLLGLLSYLHGHRPPIIYRDLKPENIIVCPDGDLRVVDFGAALSIGIGCEYIDCIDYEGQYNIKQAGTLGYAAPEQLREDCLYSVADERSDIYTFGATLHHMLTGCSPHMQPYESASMPVRSVNPPLTHDIERIVKKCTAADASMRYLSAEDVKRDLEQINHPDRQKKSSVLRRIEKKVWLADKKATGLLGTGILLCGMLLGGFTFQVKGKEAPLPVTVYNKQGQKLIIRYDSIYRTEGSLVFELEQKLFTGEGIKELGISLTDSETGERQERIFYIQGVEIGVK